MGIRLQYLHMGKLVVVKLIQWLVYKINLVNKYFNLIKVMVLYRVQ